MLEFCRKFCRDRRGNYALMTVLAMVPLMGGVAMAVDFTGMTREKQMVVNALDAANFATARRLVEGATDDQLKAYALDFFNTNLNKVDPADTTLDVVLPSSSTGGGILKLCAALVYHPYFLPAAAMLVGKPSTAINYSVCSEVRLKNTLEVAMVLDNSGSMTTPGTGSGQKRIDLLKQAAKQLVDTLALQAGLIKQIDKPVQFSLVPFAASVNVGANNDNASWIDAYGLSPIHNENFDWSTLNASDKYAQKINGIWYKKGTGWGRRGRPDADPVLALPRHEGGHQSRAHCRQQACRLRQIPFQSYLLGQPRRIRLQRHLRSVRQLAGLRRGPALPLQCQRRTGLRRAQQHRHRRRRSGNDVRADVRAGRARQPLVRHPGSGRGRARRPMAPQTAGGTTTHRAPPARPGSPTWPSISSRGRSMRRCCAKGAGPNYSCTTTPITPLTDVTKPEGLAAIKAAIDLMAPNGNTNVPEGTAWGWRTVSSGEPFTEGRPETERGNDKVVIVLTDGENTYSTAEPRPRRQQVDLRRLRLYRPRLQRHLGRPGCSAARRAPSASSTIRSSNYTAALNEQMATLCNNAKAANIMVMTVALDMSATDAGDQKAMDALKTCSSDSRFRKDPTDPSKPAKLFWNATGATLSDNFKEIANELSNLRVIG